MRFCLAIAGSALVLVAGEAVGCATDLLDAVSSPHAESQATGDLYVAIANAKAKHQHRADAWAAAGVRSELLPQFRVPPGQPRGVTVLVHGYAHSPLAMRAIADYLREKRGQIVIDVLLEGHGYRDPQLVTRGTIPLWRANIDEMLELGQSIGLPLSTVGFSIGGTLVIDAVHRHRDMAFHHVGLIAPLVSISTLFQHMLGWRRDDEYASRHSREPLSAIGYNWVLCSGLRLGVEVMKENERCGAQHVHANGLFLVTTERDRFVSSESAQRLTVTGGRRMMEHFPRVRAVSHHGLLEMHPDGTVPAVEALAKLDF